MATTVPHKGGREMIALDKCLDFIFENGDESREILIKGDQGAAMKCLTRGIQEERKKGKTVVEEAPVK
eukprot:4009786-Karenia_brevis.AAC.1